MNEERVRKWLHDLNNRVGMVLANAELMQFEKLSIPKRLERIETEIRANRVSDPERLVPLLEKIETDQQIMNYARTQAGKIKKEIQAGKK